MRRTLIHHVLPICFCVMPLLAAALVAVAFPREGAMFYLEHFSPMDMLIMGLGLVLFGTQMLLSWRALHWRGTGFDDRPDGWLSNLAQAAEWFPMLGLIGTVGGILQTFSHIKGGIPQEEIIRRYAPAITATGSGLFMALINILPTWVVLIGRGLILALGGGAFHTWRTATMIQLPKRSVTRFFIPLIDVMTLLFCIFLLMPIVEPDSSPGAGSSPSDELGDLYRKGKNLGNRETITEREQEELEQLRKEKIKTLQNRLVIRVLEIDGQTGNLFYYGPEPVKITNEGEAHELIQRQKEEISRLPAEGWDRELYYLFLRPRNSPYPLARQRKQYEHWFEDVAHGFDDPLAER